VLPPVSKSGHNVVLMTALNMATSIHKNREDTYIIVRIKDLNAKTLLVHALRNYNWFNLLNMNSCDKILNYFYTTAHQLLDSFLSLRRVKMNKNDKLWLNDNFRYLMRRCQYAWTRQKWEEYRSYRSKVQRAALSSRS